MQEKKRPYKDTLFFIQTAVEPQGKTNPDFLTGRPISSAVTVPSCIAPTVTERIYCMTDGESPVVYEFSRKNRASSESTCAQVRTSS